MSHAISSQTTPTSRRAPDPLLVKDRESATLTLLPRRRRDALAARLLAPRLDARLAAGEAPESGRLLAARALQLVDPASRGADADAWEALLERAGTPSRPTDPRVPPARGAVLTAAAEIRALAAGLRARRPVAARDVARARGLLVDGRGPVYRPGRDLRAVVARLVVDLEPPRR